jgi:hypothetical protein
MAPRRIAKQILGTITAVLSGWFAAMLFLEAITVLELLHQPRYIMPDALWVGPITVSIVMAYLVIPVWLFILIPLYIFVPSAFWRLSYVRLAERLPDRSSSRYGLAVLQVSEVSPPRRGRSTFEARAFSNLGTV